MLSDSELTNLLRECLKQPDTDRLLRFARAVCIAQRLKDAAELRQAADYFHEIEPNRSEILMEASRLLSKHHGSDITENGNAKS